MTKTLLGKIAPERVKSLDIERPPQDLIDGFKALGDASGIVSDVMDHLGIAGTLPGSLLRPTIPGATIVGPAMTLRNTVLRS